MNSQHGQMSEFSTWPEARVRVKLFFITGFKNNNNTGKTANKVKQEEKTKEKHYIIRGLVSQGKIQSQHLGNMLHD